MVSTLVSLAAVSCATARQIVYVAPSNETVTAETVASYDGIRQLIYVTNSSTVPIVITSLQLRACENIRNRCEVTRLRVPVGPGQRVLVATIEPENRERAYTYRYYWTWEVAAGHEQPRVPSDSQLSARHSLLGIRDA